MSLHFKGPLAPFQIETCSYLTQSNEDMTWFWPRNHAKTTIVSKAYVLWARCFAKKRLTLLLSQTEDQAIGVFRDISDALVNHNDAFRELHRDFPDRFRIVRLNDHEVEFDDGAIIKIGSQGKSIRGMARGGERPDLIILDDLENDETVATPIQRQKVVDWVNGVVLPMRNANTGRVIWVGTLLHEDSAMKQYAKNGASRVIEQRALITEPSNAELWNECGEVWNEAARAGGNGLESARAFYLEHKAEMDEGGACLWPEQRGLFFLWAEKRRLGAIKFSYEYQNDPVAAENQIIRKDQIVDFHMRTEVEQGKGVIYLVSERGTTLKLSDCTIGITVDPAISQKTSADFFALGVFAIHHAGTRWLLDLVHDHLSFREQIDAILDTYVHWRTRAGDIVTMVGIESVMYQKALKQAVDEAGRARGLALPTVELHPVSDKLLRLTRCQPSFEQGLVHVQKEKHPVVVEEITGFTRDGKIFPRHDDACDVVTYGLHMAEQQVISPLLYTGFRV